MADPYKWLIRHGCDRDKVSYIVRSSYDLSSEKESFLKSQSYHLWKGIEEMAEKSKRKNTVAKPTEVRRTVWLSADLRTVDLKEECLKWGENSDNVLIALIDAVESGASINFKADVEENRIKGMIFFTEDDVNYGLSAFGASGHKALVSLMFKWFVMLPDVMDNLDPVNEDFG